MEVTSWAELVAAIKKAASASTMTGAPAQQQQEQQQQQNSTQSSPSSATPVPPAPVHISLGGRTLNVPPASADSDQRLCISGPGTRVHLVNGSLTVPDSWGVQVMDGASLTLQGIAISRESTSQVPLIDVTGEGTSATIIDCTFNGATSATSSTVPSDQGSTAPSDNGSTAPPRRSGRVRGDAIHVSKGASALVARCTISGAGGAGIWAIHPNTIIAASEVTVTGCTSDAFAAHQGARIKAEHCKAVNNAQSGFLAWQGGSLELGPACVAENNGGCGFKAKQGGRISASGGCVARGNQWYGFRATSVSQVRADDSCVSEGNKLEDWSFKKEKVSLGTAQC
jgi:hypothetical protein